MPTFSEGLRFWQAIDKYDFFCNFMALLYLMCKALWALHL